MTEVKLRLIGAALLVAMISEEMESKLLVPGLYRSGLGVNVDPVVKPLLQQLIVEFRITDTLSMHNQPPKSPLSGGLQKLRAARSYW